MMDVFNVWSTHKQCKYNAFCCPTYKKYLSLLVSVIMSIATIRSNESESVVGVSYEGEKERKNIFTPQKGTIIII